MALDGFVLSNVVYELKEKLVGGRINKIAQPEKDELILTIKAKETYRLLCSAGAGLPLIYLTEENKPNPLVAPNFCMLLRKHLNSARILDITQPGFERIVNIKIEHLNDMGDLCIKTLVIELMGKHSNIIFIDDQNQIIDSIKRVSSFVSSIREVLPGRTYFIPHTQDKLDPINLNEEELLPLLQSKPMPISKAIYTTLTGFSPLVANEACHRASIDANKPANTLKEFELLHIIGTIRRMMEDVKEHNYTPNIVYDDKAPIEFSCLPLTVYSQKEAVNYSSISALLEEYYASKNQITRIRQKSADLRKIVQNTIERTSKKYDLQLKQLKDTEQRDKYKVYGELITTYGYELEPGAKVLNCLNYYTNETISIPLNELLTPMENAKRYFEKYNKLKRTFEHLSELSVETKEELDHLESIRTSLDIALLEEDLVQLKEELMDYGYMKRKFKSKNPNQKKTPKKVKITSKPFHYVSSDGYHIYVGKNNFQNDELTFDFAVGNDWWFHAKKIPGSHVVVKTHGDELPDRTFEEAGRLAAYYSSARESDKVEIDYTEKKNVKKPSGGKPGFVVYYTNYSLMASPDISDIQKIDD